MPGRERAILVRTGRRALARLPYTAKLDAVLVVLPVVAAAWWLRRVEATYGLGDGLRAGGWLRGRPVAICLLWLGSVMAVWGIQSQLAFPPFEGETNTVSHFVGLVAGTLVLLAPAR